MEIYLAYMNFPSWHWRNTRTNNPLDLIIKEIKRRAKIVGAFSDGESALTLATARLMLVAFTKWGAC
ncbi:transposase [Leptospira broomii]